MYLGFIILQLPLIALLSALIYLPFWRAGKRLHGKRPFLRHLACYTLIGYLLSLTYLTLLWYWPDITFQPGYYLLNLRPFIWLTEVYDMGWQKMIQQLVLNIGMFVPLGLLLPVVFPKLRRLWKTALIALCVTLFIETVQYFMGRSADIDDVLTNFAGGVLGYLLFYGLNRLFCKKPFWRGALGEPGEEQNA